jgi:hypothetical protein
MQQTESVIVISGIPRSGTSMVMKMLAAGGIEIVTDNLRKPDIDNPEGYFEFEKVKRLKDDFKWLAEMKGKGIKIISHLLYYLPMQLNYKIIFIRRNMEEILASQKKMFERLHKTPDDLDDSILAKKFSSHLVNIDRWINKRDNIECFYVHYNEIVQDPHRQAENIGAFLGSGVSVDNMASVVDLNLYRNRMNS